MTSMNNTDSDQGRNRDTARPGDPGRGLVRASQPVRWPEEFLSLSSASVSVGDKTPCERRCFISALEGRAARAIADAVRSHRRVENTLQGSLEVSFAEDKSRLRQGHGAENFSRLRPIALSPLKAGIHP